MKLRNGNPFICSKHRKVFYGPSRTVSFGAEELLWEGNLNHGIFSDSHS